MTWNDQTQAGFNNGADTSAVNGSGDNQAARQYPANPIYPQAPAQPVPQSSPQQLQQLPPQQYQQQAQARPQPQSQPQPQATRLPADGAYSGQALLGAQPGQDSDRPDSADDIWINRTKQAIAETQNDPHRQVQLVQHLSVLYLKERFNREVQTDKG